MRKKYTTIALTIILTALILAGIYSYYGKNRAQYFIQPPVTNQETTFGGAPGNGAPDNNAPDNGTSEGATVMAPDFTLKDLDGSDVTLSDYRGKIVILNFWAVWCRYCKEEMPDFDALDKELKEGDEAVILAVDVQESRETVSKYISSNNFELRVLLDEDGSVAASYGVEGYPNTFIINGDGSLYAYIPGATDIKTLRTLIEKAKNKEPLR